MDVIIRVDAQRSGLVVLGEVYVLEPDPSKEDQYVQTIHASNGNDFSIALVPNSYILKFHITSGSGAYRVLVLQEDGTPIAYKDFDTKNGITGKSVRFEVRQ